MFFMLGPSDSLVPVKITPMRNGIHRVDYTTDEIGVYRVEVFYSSQLIAAPYLVEVADPSKVKVFDVQEGLTGKDASFKGILTIILFFKKFNLKNYLSLKLSSSFLCFNKFLSV